MDKLSLRKKYLQKREALSEIDVLERSLAICQKVIGNSVINHKKNLLCYLAVNNEVNTSNIIKFASKKSVVYIPCFFKKKYGIARFENFKDLEAGPYNILQPKNPKIINVDIIDVALVPALAFDKGGFRLGYGKGVYDRLLGDSKALKIGLAYDFQIVEDLPKGNHDVKVDLIISEKRTIRVI